MERRIGGINGSLNQEAHLQEENKPKRRNTEHIDPQKWGGPRNKISLAQKDFALDHINAFPLYASPYTKVKFPRDLYLPIGLTYVEMHALYKEKCMTAGIAPVSEVYYRKLMSKERNLTNRRPVPFCCTCEEFDLEMKKFPGTLYQIKLKGLKESHFNEAECIKTAKEYDRYIASSDPTALAFMFELEKSLPVPSLPEQREAAYFRKLAIYNLCIRDLGKNRPYMFLWHEGVASRGSEEIASCLERFLEVQPKTLKHVIVYSNNSGGRNRNSLFVKFWLNYLSRNQHIESVDHKFFEPGHDSIECKMDFYRVELDMKHIKLQVPHDFSRRLPSQYTYCEMDKFLDFKGLSGAYADEVPAIHKMKWMRFLQQEPNAVFYRKTFTDSQSFVKVNLKTAPQAFPSTSSSAASPATHERLEFIPTENPIDMAKYNDLMKLLKKIDAENHPFYKHLPVQQEKKVIQEETINDDDLEKNCYDSC